ncbi:MFS transporter [Phenylobacterium sp. LjRoot225]|uniref:MFS transporter n=1 Tax=Phenylobacterium sp. LjRoot225 TaxID=3342285 RepID=UPI003ECD39A1
MTQTGPAPALSLPAVLAFAVAALPVGALQLALTVHLPRYFASHMGLSLAVVGGAFALVRAIDIPLDPILGLMMDRTRSRFGRYRLWAACGPLVTIAALYVLMHPPGAVGQAFLVSVLLVMFLGYSAMYLAQQAWAASLAPSYQQRSRIFAIIIWLSILGSVSVLLVPVVMEKLGYSDAQGVEAMIWFVIVAAPVTTLLMIARTPERIAPDHAHHFSLRDYGRLLVRPNVVRLVASDLCIQLGPGWMAALYLFYFTTKRGFAPGQANLLLLVYITAGFVGAPATAWLAARLNKHRALIVCTTAYSLCLMGVPFIPYGDFLAAVPLMLAAGAAFAGFLVSLRSLTADIADEIRLETGREWTGLIFALTNATTKLATAAAIFLTFGVLSEVGFDPREGAANTAYALRGLEIAFLSGPIVFVMLGGLCFVGYKLDQVRHADIRRQLEARDLQHGGTFPEPP